MFLNNMGNGLVFLLGKNSSSFVDNPCMDVDVLRVIYFIKSLLTVVFIVVPILLIVFLSFDMAKNVIAGGEDEMRKNFGVFIKRIIFCCVVFFIMPLVNFFMNFLDDSGVLDGWGSDGVSFASCYTNATQGIIEKAAIAEKTMTTIDKDTNEYGTCPYIDDNSSLDNKSFNDCFSQIVSESKSKKDKNNDKKKTTGVDRNNVTK